MVETVEGSGSNLLWVRHSMTSSASTRIECGIVNPSTLAVFRLMTSSNRVGC
jgi:hypothetical protein